ncbi:MAG TPA: retroviral-like aspartic protease family protein [Gallionella sp.]|nr:retroviral-like aspartic protease family protein [Gallionella sp.]
MLFLFLPGVATAAVFKCVDHGQVTYSASPCGENAQVLSAKSDQPQQQQGEKLTLYLDANHSFRVPGTIKKYPVTFVVDTGASNTIISERVATAAGIRTCTTMGYSSTANGLVPNCVVTVPDMSFGMFHFNNLIVTIMPKLSVDALLGMDVLRRMKIEQQGDVMFISN